MFEQIKRIFGGKREDSPQSRIKMAQHLSGRHIKYVTERKGDVEEVIGREGAMIIHDDEFLVYASQDVLFRAKITALSAWELLSLNGAVLSAPDLEHGGEPRTIIAYYLHY